MLLFTQNVFECRCLFVFFFGLVKLKCNHRGFSIWNYHSNLIHFTRKWKTSLSVTIKHRADLQNDIPIWSTFSWCRRQLERHSLRFLANNLKHLPALILIMIDASTQENGLVELIRLNEIATLIWNTITDGRRFCTISWKNWFFFWNRIINWLEMNGDIMLNLTVVWKQAKQIAFSIVHESNC